MCARARTHACALVKSCCLSCRVQSSHIMAPVTLGEDKSSSTGLEACVWVSPGGNGRGWGVAPMSCLYWPHSQLKSVIGKVSTAHYLATVINTAWISQKCQKMCPNIWSICSLVHFHVEYFFSDSLVYCFLKCKKQTNKNCIIKNTPDTLHTEISYLKWLSNIKVDLYWFLLSSSIHQTLFNTYYVLGGHKDE